MILSHLISVMTDDCEFVITVAGHECASDICNVIHTNINDSRLNKLDEKAFAKLGVWNVVAVDTVKCNYSYYKTNAINITISPPKTKTFESLRRSELFDDGIKPMNVYYNGTLVFRREYCGPIEGDMMLEKYNNCYYEYGHDDESVLSIFLIDMAEHVQQEIDKLLIESRSNH